MADQVDTANDNIEMARQAEQTKIQAKAKLDKGTEGDCELCGEWSGRLINDACAFCRDKYKLP